MFVDLHVHSLKSDGSHSPKEVVELAHSANITLLALADHDTSQGISEAAKTAHALGVKFCGGIEFTAHESEDSYEHILGYGISLYDPINAYLDKLRQERTSLVHQYIKVLNSNGFDDISFEAVSHLTPGNHLTVMYVAKWLNYKLNIRNRYSLYIGTTGKYHIPENCHYLNEVIPLIRISGGIAVLAHPFRYHPEFRYDILSFDKHIRYLINCGLNGIEAFYGEHSPKDVELCLSMAEKYQLLVTGGSDFHGWADKVPMGVNIPSEYLAHLYT